MHMLLSITMYFVLTTMSLSQEKIGNWKVDHFKRFGEWESFCDHKMQDQGMVRRCYVRRVEVYSDRPKFGALYFFLTEEKNDGDDIVPKLEFGFEPGTQFHGRGFVVEANGKSIYQLNTGSCENGHRCFIRGVPGFTLQSHMTPGNQFRFRFTDKRGDKWDIRWETDGYQSAVEDFKLASKERGLPNE